MVLMKVANCVERRFGFDNPLSNVAKVSRNPLNEFEFGQGPLVFSVLFGPSCLINGHRVCVEFVIHAWLNNCLKASISFIKFVLPCDCYKCH